MAGASVPDCSDATLSPLTAIAGAKVAGSDGKPLGTVAEVMIESGAGRIAYVALSVGGVLGVGERLFAVPWPVFVVDPIGGGLAVRFAGDSLDGRPGFDRDNWPTCADTSLGFSG
ncbi:MAG: PRC-barrel domain-containing protein [Janthinobacterium lividum]